MKQRRNYDFGDQLSEAIRAIKRCEGSKISIIQDELGYSLGLNGGSAVERWRQGFLPPALDTRAQLARELIRRSCASLDRAWLESFLENAEHPYPQQLCDELFPTETAPSPSQWFIPPPPPLPVPNIPNFVGRVGILESLMEQLHDDRLALIVGMAGIGKTAVAAQLARRTSLSTFWHRFHEDEGPETLIWKLAAFLAHHNQPGLWQLLQGTQQSGGTPPPTATLFDYLRQAVQQFESPNTAQLLLCFDDLQFVADEPHVRQFLTGLQTVPSVQLIITARKRPLFLKTSQFQPLTGLDLAETAQLLQQHDLSLNEQLQQTLQEQTGGNVQFLLLAIDALRRTRSPTDLLQRLAETDDVAHYLLEQIDERLSRDERRVMTACAVLLGQAGTADALAAIANHDSVQRTLRNLVSRHLLTVQLGEAGRVYQQHAILQGFYYEINGRRQQRRLHQRAAHYYEHEEVARLKAVRHYQAATQYHKAARLVTTDVSHFVNQGQAYELLQLLHQAAEWQLDGRLWVHVFMAQAQLETVLGHGEQAKHHYQRALQAIESWPQAAEGDTLRAKICLGMGTLLEPETPKEAVGWLERGLACQPTDPEVLAALHLASGTAHIHLGALTAALSALEQGLGHLPSQATQLRSQVWRDSAVVYFHQGKVEQAKEATYRALEISERLHDWFQMAYLLSNLGVFKFTTADWTGAIQDWKQAHQFAQHVGSQEQLTHIEINLGSAYLYQGKYEQAEPQLTQALARARQHHFDVSEMNSLHRLAELQGRRGEGSAALRLIKQAWELANKLNAQTHLAEIQNCWAEIELQNGRLTAADAHVRKALDTAQTIGIREQEGISYRILGELTLARGQLREAKAALKQSLAALPTQMPYELARAKAVWGQILQLDGNQAQGNLLLQEAKAIFQTLGVEHKETI